jgi:UDP-N-acetylglucosamine--N-acetylmuramyl-(pentapeptide) pyrophosphoryl-undecaprenol N-acetylglucosamine transferase
LVPAAGIPISYISVGGLRGKGLGTRLLAPLRLLWALAQSLGTMLRLRPRAVLGLGGFVSGPGGLAAWLTRRPLLIHEQNAVAGLTNRILAPLAGQVMEAFPGSFAARRRATTVGNPVRREISDLPAPLDRLQERRGPTRLLVFGGSQGALSLNRLVPAALGGLPAGSRPEVLHQTGERTRTMTVEAYREADVEARIVAFIEDMAQAYAWADLVVCRAGALSVSELAAAGLGSVLIPFPAAVDDHQTRNADYLVAAGAAVLAPEAGLTPESLLALLEPLLTDRARLLRMAERARDRARPDALEVIIQACLQAAGQEVAA